MNNLFAQVGTPSMDLSIMGYGVALLLLVAVVLGASAIVNHRNNFWKVSLTQGLGSLLWASPVIAVLAFVAMRVVPQFQFGTDNPPKDALPTWLQTEEGAAKVKLVDDFPPQASSVTMDLETTSEESLPEWTSQPIQLLGSTKGNRQNEVWRITLESGEDVADWKLSEAEARASVAAKAAELIQEDFRRFYSGGTKLPPEKLQTAVRAELVTERTFGKDSDPFKGYKVYWQVELSPKVRQELSGTWKQEVAAKRAWLVGEVLALLTLISISFAAYFHLDQKSNGAYRFRLKLAATALMTAGALGVLATLSNV